MEAYEKSRKRLTLTKITYSKWSSYKHILLFRGISNFLLVENNFFSERHLTQPAFIYKPGRPFTKNKGRIQKFIGTRVSRYISQNDLHVACF